MITITIGFTQSDRKNNYSSYTDGYRPGAHQETVTIQVPGADPADTATLAHIAEAVFEASNAPGAGPAFVRSELARGIYASLAVARASGARLRSLSVGDTVSAGDFAVACQPGGWKPVQVVPCSW